MNTFKTEDNQTLREYKACFQPTLLLDSGLNVVYKNSAAKAVNIKPRVGTNIKKYMDCVNVEKLCGAIEKREFKILRLDINSPVKRCVVHPGGDSAAALVFYDSLNLLRQDDENERDTMREIENIILKYNEYTRTIIRPDGGEIPDADKENRKKLMKINAHFMKHLSGLNPRNSGRYKRYCDIGAFLNEFASGISQYINPFGYKITFDIEDKMFLYDLNAGDLTSINFILSAFALKHAIFGKVNVKFYDAFYTGISGILRYEFVTRKDFRETHGDMFLKDYLNDIKNMEYLDLNLAALIAKNNGLKLSVHFDDDDGSKVCLDLVFRAKNAGLESPRPGKKYRKIPITAENIKEQSEIELAGIFQEQ